jgi:dihydroorotase
LEDKYQIAARTSLANYTFFIGASNDNLEEVMKTDINKVCGLKIFMGSSTGNLLVDDHLSILAIYNDNKLVYIVPKQQIVPAKTISEH